MATPPINHDLIDLETNRQNAVSIPNSINFLDEAFLPKEINICKTLKTP